jgi:hypothetical protein
MNWLDTQTQEILQKARKPKPVVAKAGEFALLLIAKGNDEPRLLRAIRRVNDCNEAKCVDIAAFPPPVIVDAGLTESEALFGQFELVCCDAVSAFVRSEIVQQNGIGYLDALCRSIANSPEFRRVPLRVNLVPKTDEGELFIDQFLGSTNRSHSDWSFPLAISVPFKKARIMKHWAERIGALVECDQIPNSAGEDDRS